MKTIQLGNTDLTVTRYCQGTAFRHLPRHADEPLAERVLRHCLDRGVTFFDSAYAYGWGGAEELLGKVVHGRRDLVVICTKVPPTNPPEVEENPGTHTHFTLAYLQEQLDAALGRLGTDYVDIYSISPTPKHPPGSYVRRWIGSCSLARRDTGVVQPRTQRRRRVLGNRQSIGLRAPVRARGLLQYRRRLFSQD